MMSPGSHLIDPARPVGGKHRARAAPPRCASSSGPGSIRSVLMLSPKRPGAPGEHVSGHARPPINSPASAICPAIAEAATVAGEAMKMRALGSPMRPLKLRVLAVMQVSPGPEHPHMPAKAGAAGRRGHHRAGLDQRLDIAGLQRGGIDRLRSPASRSAGPRARPCGPCTTRAASARSSSVPLAQEPINAWSIFSPATSATGTELRITASGSATSGVIAREVDRPALGIGRRRRRGAAARTAPGCAP